MNVARLANIPSGIIDLAEKISQEFQHYFHLHNEVIAK